MFPTLGYILAPVLFYLLTQDAVYMAVKKALHDHDNERSEPSKTFDS